ncbi:4'-phosphopantetheinyl transferase superfamily protein [Desulfoprunum benzoelyticum]|uniref:Enterobactin synthase component D n=1 Tax=Desulfoprunum benzoelyticum TaxID=1506996 RepID=A0A840UMK6_9BACT|nr:4'-phosphopantetheinyl transferase superfamily protein [Desulfoprunum benzoelyticum]MBB5347012.1 4'-phosphopantetheinyl transferase EntD [Desulfoprunum benzoelyticum]MBM9531620.1 4'-phosphopantetheinyl transferase superfamily protein [Desulfoprunum benzoelyticum]
MPKSPAATLSLLEKTLPVVFSHHPAALSLAAVVNPDAYLARPPGSGPVVLADPELAALAAYTLPKRRAQWLTGRICAKQATSAYLRKFLPQLPLPDARDIMIANLPSGRPEIAGPFAAVSGIDLSISHSGGYAAALVAAAACGIDIQEDSPTLERICARFCQPQEAQILQRHLPDLQPIPRLNLLWTAKEAARKAVGRERMPGFLELVLRRCEATTGDCTVLVLGQDPSAPQSPRDLPVLTTRFEDLCLSVVLTHGGNAHA